MQRYNHGNDSLSHLCYRRHIIIHSQPQPNLQITHIPSLIIYHTNLHRENSPIIIEIQNPPQSIRKHSPRHSQLLIYVSHVQLDTYSTISPCLKRSDYDLRASGGWDQGLDDCLLGLEGGAEERE